MSHETHWDAATRELIARAEARGAKRVAQAVERLAVEWMGDESRTADYQDARADCAEDVRALLAERRAGTTR